MSKRTMGSKKLDRFWSSSAHTTNPTRARARTGDGPPTSGAVGNPSEHVLVDAGTGRGQLLRENGLVNNHTHILGHFWPKCERRFGNRALWGAHFDPPNLKCQFWIALGRLHL